VVEYLRMTEPHFSQKISNKSSRSDSPKKHIAHPIIRAFTWILAAILLSSQITPASAVEKTSISPISINKNGEFGDKSSTTVSISGDGRYIFFTSQADNLTGSDGTNQLYKFDRNTRSLDAVTGSVSSAAISGDGRIVAYTKNDQSGAVYIFDLLNSKPYPINDPDYTERLASPWKISAVSHHGRYLLVSSSPDLPDSNISTLEDPLIWLVDRITKHTKRLSTPSIGYPSSTDPKLITLSDDGRIIAFLEKSKVGGSDADRIILFNRVLDQVSYLETRESMNKLDQQIKNLDLSGNGSIVAFIETSDNGNAVGYSVFVHDRLSDQYQEILTLPSMKDIASSSLSLSNDGKYLALVYPVEKNTRILSRLSTETGEKIIIDQGEIYGPIDITADGKTILYKSGTNLLSGIQPI